MLCVIWNSMYSHALRSTGLKSHTTAWLVTGCACNSWLVPMLQTVRVRVEPVDTSPTVLFAFP